MCLYEDEDIVDTLIATRDLYNELVAKYVILNKELHLSDPIELEILFENMLHGGYLSQEGIFKCTSSNTFDMYSVPKLNGANVFAGNGICRHVTSLFSTVLDGMEIENRPLATYYYKKNQKFNELHKACRYLNMVKEIGLKETLKLPYVFAIANHGINRATFEDTNYFLDAYNNHIYIPSSDCENKLETESSFVLLRPIDFEGKNFSEKERIEEKRKKVIGVINDNYGLIKDFYYDNRDKYSEVSKYVKTLSKSEKKY